MKTIFMLFLLCVVNASYLPKLDLKSKQKLVMTRSLESPTFLKTDEEEAREELDLKLRILMVIHSV